MIKTNKNMMAPPYLSRSLPLFNMIVLVIVTSSVEGRGTRRVDEDERLLGRMVSAVELGLRFFSNDYSNINVDGLFGMRVGQGQIIQALKECKSSGSCPDELQRRLQTVIDEIDVTARAAMKYVQQTDPDYYDRFLATINRPYLLPYNPVTFHDLDSTPAGSDDRYQEEDGDDCFSRLMGTYVENGHRVKECNITDFCWSMMTKDKESQYAVTHQLLYFILIQKQGCVQIVENKMATKVAETEAKFCGSIYNEATAEAKDVKVRELFQDLFLEQVLLCGCLGFEDFLRPDWMKMVLTWQTASGCFSMNDPRLFATEVLLSQYQDEERQLIKDLQQEARLINTEHHGRKLLREQVMDDGCLSHKSGLGFGNLCLFTRYLVRQVFLDQ